MHKLKSLLLFGFLLLLLPSLHAQGVQAGPWISDTEENVSTFNAAGEKEFERSF